MKFCPRIRDAGASELLLIAGDYARPEGPYIAGSGSHAKRQAAETRIHASLGRGPPGRPSQVCPTDEIRRAQLEKARQGAAAGLEITLVTQFFFEAAPFIDWARDLRLAGVDARIVAGLPGPAKITRLLQLARHCGVGPSIRALSHAIRPDVQTVD